MIQALVDAAVLRLREQLGDALGAPGRVAAGPVPPPKAGAGPLVALSAGYCQVRRGDGAAETGVRGRAARQRVDAAPAAPGAAPLDHAPLPGTVRARLVLSAGTVAEHGVALLEGDGYTVDYGAPAVTVTANLAAVAAAEAERLAAQVQARVGRDFSLDSARELSGALFGDLGLPPQGAKNAQGYHSTARAVLVTLAAAHPVVPLVIAYRDLKAGAPLPVWFDYSFAGVVAEREFRQELWVDAYDAAPGAAERWGSLAAAVLLTWADELLAATADYPSGKSVSARHLLTRLEMVDGVSGPVDAGVHLRLGFRVDGRLQLSREDADTGAPIRHVRSPGTFSPDPVDVEPETG